MTRFDVLSGTDIRSVIGISFLHLIRWLRHLLHMTAHRQPFPGLLVFVGERRE